MPSTENSTLQRIQREISDVIEREKELRNNHVQNGSVNNNNENEMNNNIVQVKNPARPVLQYSKSTGDMNGTRNSANGIRLFTPNPATKGVMEKFIKCRGKLSTVGGFQPSPLKVQQPEMNQPLQRQTWTIPDVIEPPKVTEPGQCVRKGYVPVRVRMQQELQDLHNREMELRSVRKSQSDLTDTDELQDDIPQFGTTLKVARSLAQLYDPDEYHNEFNLGPSNLKPARSLAELCDESDEILETPGSHSLIMQWEELIQKSRQEHV